MEKLERYLQFMREAERLKNVLRSARNAGAVYGAGADVLVAGSSVFGAEDPQAEVVKMLNA